jgi:ubiquinone biosynthesis protein
VGSAGAGHDGGHLTQLTPDFDIAAGARRFAAGQFAAQFSPDMLRKTAADELIAPPTLRRLPRRIDRSGGALQAGRLSVNARLLARTRLRPSNPHIRA